jgi:hypothetical protein
MVDYRHLLPLDLCVQAYQAMNQELAWGKDEAVEVIDLLSASHIAILGGEVWIPTVPGPTLPPPNLYAWGTEPLRQNEVWTEYVKRTNERAKEFVVGFFWKFDEESRYRLPPFFNLTICDEGEYQVLVHELDMLKQKKKGDIQDSVEKKRGHSRFRCALYKILAAFRVVSGSGIPTLPPDKIHP